jgi:hypothetical protein
MKKLGPVIGVLLSTVAFLTIMVVVDPFDRINDLLDISFGAPPKWTQVEIVYCNSETQEVSHGGEPVPSLQLLARHWRQHSEARRILFVGNSQMFSITLAAGEAPPTGPEKTYVDVVADQLSSSTGNYLVYRFSPGAMSYPEALWFLQYMFLNPNLRPDYVFLQMNYQAFYNAGIRNGMLTMLDEPVFREHIERLSGSGEPYADSFQEALKTYLDLKGKQEKEAGGPSGTRSGQRSSNVPYANYGYRIETAARSLLDEVAGFKNRAAIKGSFLKMLYRERVYFFRLTPGTPRSLTGARLLTSRASIEAIARLCGNQHAKLVLFNAPVNPKVSLYRITADRDSYHCFLTSIAAQYRLSFYDFENAVPSEFWGNLLNGPDPLHLSRKGHQILADKILDALQRVTASDSLIKERN